MTEALHACGACATYLAWRREAEADLRKAQEAYQAARLKLAQINGEYAGHLGKHGPGPLVHLRDKETWRSRCKAEDGGKLVSVVTPGLNVCPACRAIVLGVPS